MAMAYKPLDTTTLKCAITGLPLEYRGYGRPPKYHPSVAAQARKDRARERHKAKREATARIAKMAAHAAFMELGTARGPR